MPCLVDKIKKIHTLPTPVSRSFSDCNILSERDIITFHTDTITFEVLLTVHLDIIV